ncbi:hypothetical protein [Thermosulfurimonas dismutans]|uniref:Uncharacterized protein n=1 Tax=Thermosulfurimonas dismutans TaxID=999894 RepID=A0A179D3N9_9BACT|nr:hypothetical protein [Thermosulfurimonas dismutans]OAQ20329.1 hypothetical protein TDIS_1524 [Thermosulfurimonas dismutans]
MRGNFKKTLEVNLPCRGFSGRATELWEDLKLFGIATMATLVGKGLFLVLERLF